MEKVYTLIGQFMFYASLAVGALIVSGIAADWLITRILKRLKVWQLFIEFAFHYNSFKEYRKKRKNNETA